MSTLQQDLGTLIENIQVPPGLLLIGTPKENACVFRIQSNLWLTTPRFGPNPLHRHEQSDEFGYRLSNGLYINDDTLFSVYEKIPSLLARAGFPDRIVIFNRPRDIKTYALQVGTYHPSDPIKTLLRLEGIMEQIWPLWYQRPPDTSHVSIFSSTR